MLLSGCALAKLGGQAISTTGKIVCVAGTVAAETIKTTGKIVTTTGKVIKTVVQIPGGKRVIHLTKHGNALFANTLLNRKVWATMMVDTGCGETLISRQLARRLGLEQAPGEPIQCALAGGYVVMGKVVTIKEIRLGKVIVKNVTAVVLEEDQTEGNDGLLGMSFLNNFIFRIDAQKAELILEKRRQ